MRCDPDFWSQRATRKGKTGDKEGQDCLPQAAKVPLGHHMKRTNLRLLCLLRNSQILSYLYIICTSCGMIWTLLKGRSTCKKGSTSSYSSWTEKFGLISLSSMLLGRTTLGCCWTDLGWKVAAVWKGFSTLPCIPLNKRWRENQVISNTIYTLGCCWMDLDSKVAAAGKRNRGLRFSTLPSTP